MIREAKESNTQSGRAMTEQIQQYILQYLAEDITMETVAAALHISYYYMCHFFKVQTGISPNAYRQQKRMEKAVRALLETNEKV